MSKLRSASVTKAIARDEFESLWGRGTPLNGQRTPRVQRIANSNNNKINVTQAECKNSQFIIPIPILSHLNLHLGRTKLILAMVFYLMLPCSIKDVCILHVCILQFTIWQISFCTLTFLMVVYSTNNDHIYAVLAASKHDFVFFFNLSL